MTNKPIIILLTFFLAACASPRPVENGSTNRETTSATVTQSVPVSQNQATPITSPQQSATVPPDAPTATVIVPASLSPTVTPAESDFAVRTSPVDGMPQVYVPAGTLRMGGLDVYSVGSDELPAHTVSLDAFWIDQLEVTNAMYMLCVQAGACNPPMNWSSEKRFSYFNNEDFKDYPVVHVTWGQAESYCAWAKRRLPTEAEWERAARGDDLRNFPWGDEPPGEIYANYNRLVDDTSRVGSYQAGASPFGALDMAGNVWEWVTDFYGLGYYNISPEHNPSGPETSSTYRRILRGGSFQDGWVNLRVSKRGSALGPIPNAPFDAVDRLGDHSSKIGFRCVASE